MTTSLRDFTLDPDLRTGVVPISKAASSIAALIKQANATRRPIVVTQKGRPEGVLISVELFELLRQLVQGEGAASTQSEATDSTEAP
jgi:prevent-host-death family protein